MELTNEFRVGIPKTEAWKILTDVERIAPFLPGAQLQEVEGDEYRGVVKVKVGPITAQYKGTARFLEREEDAGRVVLSASGRDTRGQGNATATITATMIPEGEGTLVKVVTDLRVTGKVAQFGRGVLADVSSKLLGQFVEALEADLAGSQEEINRRETADESAEGNSSGATVDSGAFSSEPRPIEAKEVEPVNLLSVAGSSVLRQVLPLLAGATGVILIVLGRRWIRRFRAPRQ
jgi:carbon monoxide dehydrogenase subunit G